MPLPKELSNLILFRKKEEETMSISGKAQPPARNATTQ